MMNANVDPVTSLIENGNPNVWAPPSHNQLVQSNSGKFDNWPQASIT